MIDLHTHILYGLDDGALDRETMLRMFRMAAADGTREMVATPHHISGADRYSPEQLEERLREARELLKEHEIPIRLHGGQELFLEESLTGELEGGRARCLGDTRFVLVEFPMTGIPGFAEGMICRLKTLGYQVILAHPERCADFQQDPGLLEDYILEGCLTQINAGSMTGRMGRRAAETAEAFLMSSMVHLVASDCHSAGGRPPGLSGARNRVRELRGNVVADRIFGERPEMILAGQMPVVPEPHWQAPRRSWLGRLKAGLSFR